MSIHLADKKTVWFQSYSGKKIFPLEFESHMVDLEDICHALALTNRFAGHTIRPYSVGEHLLNCVSYARQLGESYETRINCLTHDFAEAYIQDIISPIKRYLRFANWSGGPSSYMPKFDEVEKNIEAVIYQTLGLPFPFTEKCKEIDLMMLSIERRDIMQNSLPIDYEHLPEPDENFIIHPDECVWRDVKYDLLRNTEAMIGLWADVKKGRKQWT